METLIFRLPLSQESVFESFLTKLLKTSYHRLSSTKPYPHLFRGEGSASGNMVARLINRGINLRSVCNRIIRSNVRNA